MDAIAQLKASLAERYEIAREIGAGGMATVYLAHDLRNDRPVALKLLNPELGAVLGVERFLAEIKVTANLQHPNLLPLFDSGAADGLLYYVMPFVEGESLRARLDREKQLPVDEAVRMAVAIANALDYAHSHGVIHRDLKPENILLQHGQPVIADFGIALAVSNAGGNRITQTGLSLGTPQYMSPEQATGDRVIDGRSDIYSLGAVAYEMLTGEPPHVGSTSQAIIARMLTENPRPMRVTRPSIPEHVELAVLHALEKLPADRFSAAHQFAEALLGHSTVGVTAHAASQKARASRAGWKARVLEPLTLGLAAVAIALAVALGSVLMKRPSSTSTERTIRYTMAGSDSLKPVGNFPWPAAISVDGGTVVYTGAALSGPMLYSLRTDQIEPHPIPGTNGGSQPIFSPDGQWIAFLSSGKLRKVKLDGSQPITITDASANNGVDWTSRDEIILSSEGGSHGLSRISADGGALTVFSKPDTAGAEIYYLWPVAMPDGKSVAFTIWTGLQASAELATVAVDGGDIVKLGVKGLRPLAVIDRTLVYLQPDGIVMALRLDRSHRHAEGKPVPILDQVRVSGGNNGNSGIFVSPGGALVSDRGGQTSALAWIGQNGLSNSISSELKVYSFPRISPDGQRIAVTVRENDRQGISIYDIGTKTFVPLATVSVTTAPEWSRDGKSVFYIDIDEKSRSVLYSHPADGGTVTRKIAELRGRSRGLSLAPDGKSLVYVTYIGSQYQLYRLNLDSVGEGKPFLASSVNSTSEPQISPDGRWIAVTSSESGPIEVYVRTYPDPTFRIQISSGGGGEGLWSKDGKTVFYRAGTSEIAARLATTPNLRVVSRDTVIRDMGRVVSGGLFRSTDLGPDGRFLGLISNRNDFQLVVAPNWRVEMEQRIAAARH